MNQARLPSWRTGATRDAIEIFLDAAEMQPIEQRVAVFDVDGTLWCEQPRYPIVDFYRAELQRAAAARPEVGQRPEYRAVLDEDHAAVARLGQVNVMLALAELHAGTTPEAYQATVREHVGTAQHRDRHVPLSQLRYRPMLDLIAELRARHFSVYLVTGSGTEFVRAVSQAYFGVPPEGVVGAQVTYELDHSTGVPRLLRTRELVGDPNEGAARIAGIQRLLGRRPMLAAGNARGDAEMLAYACAFEGPSLALLVEHDDAEREYAYGAASLSGEGWVRISMRADWATVFADT